jgi:hypothetical protein
VLIIDIKFLQLLATALAAEPRRRSTFATMTNERGQPPLAAAVAAQAQANAAHLSDMTLKPRRLDNVSRDNSGTADVSHASRSRASKSTAAHQPRKGIPMHTSVTYAAAAAERGQPQRHGEQDRGESVLPQSSCGPDALPLKIPTPVRPSHFFFVHGSFF